MRNENLIVLVCLYSLVHVGYGGILIGLTAPRDCRAAVDPAVDCCFRQSMGRLGLVNGRVDGRSICWAASHLRDVLAVELLDHG
jgi:hypothetical protein